MTLRKRLSRIQGFLYRFLERPSGMVQVVYHLGIFAYVLLTLCLSALDALDDSDHPNENSTGLRRVIFAMEVTLALYLGIEFLLRLYSVGHNPQYTGFRGRLRHLLRFISIIDMLIIFSTIFLLANGGGRSHKFVGSKTVQNLRFLQILRLLHVDRATSTWKIMQKVVVLHKTELIAAYYLSFLGLLVMATVVYITEISYEEALDPERESEPTFKGYGDALWWAVITFMTIGYGDIVPKCWISKLVTCIFAISCLSLFTLVSSIIGVGLSLMVQEREKKKMLQKQLPLAASVIQCYYRARLIWRKFGAMPKLKDAMMRKLMAHELRMNLAAAEMLISDDRRLRHNLSLNSMAHIIRRTGKSVSHTLHHIAQRLHTHDQGDYGYTRGGVSPQETGGTSGESTSVHRSTSRRCSPEKQPHFSKTRVQSDSHLASSFSEPDCSMRARSTTVDSDYSSSEGSPAPLLDDLEFGSTVGSSRQRSSPFSFCKPNFRVGAISASRQKERAAKGHRLADGVRFDNNDEGLPEYYRIAVACVWQFKFFGAKKRFKQSRRPYDLLDIIEEMATSDQEQFSKLKEVQTDVDFVLGRPGLSLLTREQKQLNLVQRLRLVEGKMAELDHKADLILQLATQLGERVWEIKAAQRAKLKDLRNL